MSQSDEEQDVKGVNPDWKLKGAPGLQQTTIENPPLVIL